MNKCPFCGAEGHGMIYGYTWECCTHLIGDTYVRNFNCYEAESATLRKLVKEMEPYMRCTCPYVWATLNGRQVSPNRECPVCEIRNRDEVKKILEEV